MSRAFRSRSPVVFVSITLLVSGCGGSGGAGSGGYLARSSDGVAYLQWTRTGDEATGSLTFTALVPREDGRYDLRTDDAPITAVIAEDSVTVNFEASTKWNGRIDGSAIELSYRAEDGTLRTLRFERAPQDEFNEAVAGLQETQAEAEAQVSSAEAEQEAAAQIERAADDVRYSLGIVTDYQAEFARLVEDARASFVRVQEALAATEDALAVTHSAGSYDVSYEADSTAYEADGVDRRRQPQPERAARSARCSHRRSSSR